MHSQSRVGFATALALVVLFSAVALGDTVRVDVSGGGDYETLAEGIAAASNGDTVLVAEGLYQGPLNRDLDFNGRDIVLRSESGSAATVIDCEHASRAFTFNSNESYLAVVEGVTLANGYAEHDTLNPYEGYGGAVHCYATNPTFRDVVFTGNTADGDGGALNCMFSNSTMSLIDCSFASNAAAHGGAINSDHTRIVLWDCSFTGNSASSWGGAILLDRDSSSMTRCVFSDNEGSMGGAVNFRGDYQHYLVDCSFIRNTAVHHGGAVSSYYGRPSFTRCDFVGNDAGYFGAGVGVTANPAAFEDCSFFRNVVRDTLGAVVTTSRASTFTNCTFVFNDTPYGGAIVSSGEAHPVITECIIAHTSQGVGVQCADSSEPTISYSCIFGNALGDSLCGIYHDNIFVDPALCDTIGGLLALQECSPCLDSGQGGGAIGSPLPISCPCDDPTGVPGTDYSCRALRALALSPATDVLAVAYEVPDGCLLATLSVYDVGGRLVGRTTQGTARGRVDTIVWESDGQCSSGVYFYVLEACERVARGRAVIVR